VLKTRIIKLNRQMPGWSAVSAAARVIDSGGIVCFPTDTVYGFAVSTYCIGALERLRRLKQRRTGEPFVVIASDVDLIREMVTVITPRHRRLMEAHWPGPLTIVFRASSVVPEYLTGPGGTVALRIPDDMLTQSILRACGIPLAAPSANVRGERPAVDPESVLAEFDGKIELLLDGGCIENREPSTIVTVDDGSLTVLRQGRLAVGRAER
jgi:L-threonylcarbamoyladenylate synthase